MITAQLDSDSLEALASTIAGRVRSKLADLPTAPSPPDLRTSPVKKAHLIYFGDRAMAIQFDPIEDRWNLAKHAYLVTKALAAFSQLATQAVDDPNGSHLDTIAAMTGVEILASLSAALAEAVLEEDGHAL